MNKNRKTSRRKKKTLNVSDSHSYNPRKLILEIRNLFDPDKLTTPSTVNKSIQNFCKRISDFAPFFIDIKPEPWCRQSCCNLNVKRYINENGGKMVCGYKIWYHHPIYIEAERHAVWYDNNTYKDLTFNTGGESKILFVPDIIEKQNHLKDNVPRIRLPLNDYTKKVVAMQEHLESKMKIKSMSNEESWNTMLTYEQWLSGKRMPNMQIKKY